MISRAFREVTEARREAARRERAQVAERVADALATGHSTDRIARDLGTNKVALARRLYRGQYHELARAFERDVNRERYARGQHRRTA